MLSLNFLEILPLSFKKKLQPLNIGFLITFLVLLQK